MDTRHLVDPELLPLVDVYQQNDASLSAGRLPAVREASAEFRRQYAPPPTPGTVTEAYDAGGVPVLVSRAADKPATGGPVLLWVHGGGFVMGAADQDTALLEGLAAELGCTAVAVDYRLAPETPHPGPVEDCYTALRWAADRFGTVAVGGTSAGAGLAAALALLARDRGGPEIALQVLVTPMLDDRTVVEADPNPYTGEFVWTREANEFCWRALLGAEPGSKGVSRYASAARAEDLAGLPPTFLAVGSLDLFLDEDLEYARRLLRAGVPTELHVTPGAVHGYLQAPGRPGRELRALLTASLRRVFRP